MKAIDVACVACLMAASAALGLVVGVYGAARRAAVCQERLADTLDFIGLVVGDVEASVERAGAVVGSSGTLVEAMNRRAKEAPVPPSMTWRASAVDAPSPLQTACVGSGLDTKCYVQLDGAWELLEVEP